jgi:hypothetical protein
MIASRARFSLAALALPAIAGCASHHAQLALAPPPAPPVAAMPMPQPPAGSVAGMVIPARLPDGSYATPNRYLTPDATLWHLRVGLNVAALGCRGTQGDAITGAYNALLKRERMTLASAHDRVVAESGGQAGYDEDMTRLYNYFAQPGAQQAFCMAAASVAETLGAGPISAAAAPALAALDQPFSDFYRQYDAYRVALAAWQANRLDTAMQPVGNDPQVALATAATTPIGAAAATPEKPHLTVDPAIFRRP